MPRNVAANAGSIRQIKTFPSLIKYLRDVLAWPIEADDFDNLTYDWEPEELGIDKASAAKIDEVKQLRPLADEQPWGIFFVKFEPKQLPIVALRRLLNSMVIRKRESANRSERRAWALNDLMFISSYGDSGERHISFAHFSQPKGKNDLPTLKVLGWDNSDTPLRLAMVASKLTECLTWPDDESDIDGWRETWRSAFTLRHRQTVTTAKDLSIRLAELARAIRDRIMAALAIETNKGPLTKLMKAFQSALMHDLDQAGFADMYAQTIAYGLLSARIADPKSRTADDLTAHMNTSPFLKELMQTFLHVGGRKGKAGGPGIDFDELGVSEVVELLDDANMEAVIRDFGDKRRDEDPVMHFYESFLQEYNNQLKIQRGVFYTPQPLVSFIVRNVHELLQTEFGLVDGFADTTTWGEVLKKTPGLKLPPLTEDANEKRTISPDEPFVQILDPATGTATFLVEVIDVIHATLKTKWKRQRLTEMQQIKNWNDYVPRYLLPRLHAYELMMAPYAIAHMKVGLKLAETSYDFGSDERAGIYLTNTLEPWHRQLTLPQLDALAHEAVAVNEVKGTKRIAVVMGNPPFHLHKDISPSALKKIGSKDGAPPSISVELDAVTARLKTLGYHRDTKFLWDSAVFFLLWSIKRAESSYRYSNKASIVSLILPRSLISSKFATPIREKIISISDNVKVVDLGGENRGAANDYNVFGILKAVCILTFIVNGKNTKLVKYTKVHANSDKEFNIAISTEANSLKYSDVTCLIATNYSFVPDTGSVYPSFVDLRDVAKESLNGIQLKRLWPVGITSETLELRWKSLITQPAIQRAALYVENNSQKANRTILGCGKKIIELNITDPCPEIVRFGYRSFDYQWLLYDKGLAYSLRGETYTRHRNGQGYFVGHLTKAASGSCFLTFSDAVVEADFHAKRGAKDVIPLLLTSGKQRNLAEDFCKKFESINGYSANDFMFYALAVLSSVDYCNTFSMDTEKYGLRVPMSLSEKLYDELVALGKDVATLNALGNTKWGNRDFTSLSPKTAKLRVAKSVIKLTAKNSVDELGGTIKGDGWEIVDIASDVFHFKISGYSPVRSVTGYWTNSRSKARSGLDTLFPAHIQGNELNSLLNTIHAIEGMLKIQVKLSVAVAKLI